MYVSKLIRYFIHGIYFNRWLKRLLIYRRLLTAERRPVKLFLSLTLVTVLLRGRTCSGSVLLSSSAAGGVG